MRMRNLTAVMKHPKELLTKVNYRYPTLLKWMRDESCVKFWYRYAFGKKLDLENPKTFNEKLQWLKLYDRKPEYTAMVDKCEAKKYVAERIGQEYIIPTLGVWDRFEDIDFDQLPNQFVLKCTHDSGGLVICKDKSKLNMHNARHRIERSLQRNFFWVGREWPYKDVKPRIIAEQYLVTNQGKDLPDYKMFMFEGKLFCTLVCTERNSQSGLKEDFYDPQWNHLEMRRPNHDNSAERHAKPENYEQMVALAQKLAKDIPFIRVDFYNLNGRLYFGELTFFPASGFEGFAPQQWDAEMGELLKLPNHS